MKTPKNTLADVLNKYVPDPNTGCWLWTGSYIGKGYGKMELENKKVYAHRASYELHKGPIPIGLNVLHKCDTPPCINPDHLFLGTVKENSDDMVKKGRQWNAKISFSEAKEIRLLYSSGFKRRHLIKSFGVSKYIIDYVIYGTTWQQLEDTTNGNGTNPGCS